MDWYKQRIGYYLEPDMINAGEEAEVLHQRAKAYSAQTESGGYIPAAALPLITPKRPQQRAAKLVAVGLWVAVNGGYLIADWDEDQAELEALAARRRADRERKRAQRDREQRPPQSSETSRDNSTDASRDSHVSVRTQEPGYTRADREKEKEEEHPPESLRDSGPPAGGDDDAAEPTKPKRNRGTRIPADFTITDAMRTWGKDNFPQVNGEAETEAFIDYWRAAPGAKGVKLDWPATWRNWIRKAAERTPTSRNGNTQRNGADRPVHIPRPVAEVLAEQARYGAPLGAMPLFPQVGMSLDD